MGKIADKFALSGLESIDMFFDMAIPIGSLDTQRITKKQFKDFILDIAPRDVSERDIDILFKSSTILLGKDFIDIADFRQLFEVPMQKAR